MTEEAHDRGMRVSELHPWTIPRVLSELPYLFGYAQANVLAELAPQAEALAGELERALPGLEGWARCHAAALLLRLRRPTGRAAFLAALADTDTAVSGTALDLLRTDLVPEDSGIAGQYSMGSAVPLTCTEIFTAIAPRLAAPASPEAQKALFICLRHDIAESRP